MSALAGIWWWDGRPVADALVQTLHEQSRPAGPDGGGTVRPLPGLALQAHLLHFDRHSAEERQPHVFGAGSVLCWDGRLDNRDDLLLSLHHDLDTVDSDAALVAAAYTRWGEDCFRRLVGDWSLAIWDAPERRLLLARDYCGNRPLYYRATPEGVAWATRLDALLVAFDLGTSPNEEYIAGRLTTGVPPGVTPYKTIQNLRGGHWLLASAQRQVAVRRYWMFAPRTLRYRDLHD
jgi:asparagine synthase (glutamine-hydrolysing)